jgi:hypothetical protein
MPEHKPPTLPEGFPDLPELKEMTYKALQLIDTAMGIANTGAEALSEEYSDTGACFRGIAHLLDEAAGHVSVLEQFVRDELPAQEGQR